MSASSVASGIVRALMRAQASPAWHAAAGAEERAWIALAALSEELHPHGDVTIPSMGQVETLIDRHRRDERIRAGFDGRNHEALAARFGLSPRQIRRITDRRRRGRIGRLRA